MDLFSQLESFDEYEALTDQEKKYLYPNNFWKIASGKQPINVPKTDLNYWKYWNDKVEKQAKKIYQNKQRLIKIKDEQRKITTNNERG